MGKLELNEFIHKKYNLESLLNKKNDICFEICKITSDDLSLGEAEKNEIKSNIKDKVKKYAENSKKNAPKDKDSQSGRVWFLVKENKECSEALQVAQALDYMWSEKKYFRYGYFHEITSHIDEIFEETKGSKYKEFANNIKKGDSLVFYELAIDRYLEEFAPKNYKETIYEIAKDYYAEASLAHFTQAREWGYFSSGMDKRAYYNILDNVKCVQIDKQKEIKNEANK